LQVKKAGQTRDMDTLFHNRLSQLEESLGDVKTEVQLAVADVLEGGYGWIGLKRGWIQMG